ncbi:hypothetical protein V8C43DRAFT_269478 [Trichoderma afarasin]
MYLNSSSWDLSCTSRQHKRGKSWAGSFNSADPCRCLATVCGGVPVWPWNAAPSPRFSPNPFDSFLQCSFSALRAVLYCLQLWRPLVTIRATTEQTENTVVNQTNHLTFCPQFRLRTVPLLLRTTQTGAAEMRKH